MVFALTRFNSYELTHCWHTSCLTFNLAVHMHIPYVIERPRFELLQTKDCQKSCWMYQPSPPLETLILIVKFFIVTPTYLKMARCFHMPHAPHTQKSIWQIHAALTYSHLCENIETATLSQGPLNFKLKFFQSQSTVQKATVQFNPPPNQPTEEAVFFSSLSRLPSCRKLFSSIHASGATPYHIEWHITTWVDTSSSPIHSHAPLLQWFCHK